MSTVMLDGNFERTLSVSGRVNLDVVLESGVVRIVGADVDSVRLCGTLRAKPALFGRGRTEEHFHHLETNPPIQQNGNTIRFEYKHEGWLAGLTLLLEITTPRTTVVDVVTDSGDIRVEGVEGLVCCETDSGEIEISDVVRGARAESDSGTIRMERISGPVLLKSDSGGDSRIRHCRLDRGWERLRRSGAFAIHSRAGAGSHRLGKHPLAACAGCRIRFAHPTRQWKRPVAPDDVAGRFEA